MGLDAGKRAKGELNKYFAKQIDRFIVAFQKVGESFVNDCKDSHRWLTRTGNLESSIGYVIMLNGMIIKNGLIGEPQGVEAGKKLASKVADKRGLEIIGVAGMEYAEALEAKGYNVVTVQAKWATINLRDRITKVKGIK